MIFKRKYLVPVFFIATVSIAAVILLQFVNSSTHVPFNRDLFSSNRITDSPTVITLPPKIKRLSINIGPNTGPIYPPNNDESAAVLVAEPNIGIANMLRETFQKKLYAHRFFVLNCAVSGPPLAGRIATFHFFNRRGMSSSLSKLHKEMSKVPVWANPDNFSPKDPYGPGPVGMDIVPVITLNSILSSVPKNVSIPFLKTDTQGHDFAVIKSASIANLRRVKKIMTETYLPGVARTRYHGVQNDISDWIPYMRQAGYRLMNPPPKGLRKEYDAIWIRED